jgi:Flp pilus assembly protein CpaB
MSEAARPPRAIPLLVLPLAVLVLVLLVFGVVRGIQALRGTEVVVAAKTVAAGQDLGARDLRLEEVDDYSVDEDATVTELDKALDHIAVQALAEGQPVPKAAITAVAPAACVTDELYLRFRTEQVTISGVKTGQCVDLLFAPVKEADTDDAPAIKATLLAHPSDGKDGVVWVAITSNDREALVRSVARSRLIVAPTG